MSDDQLAEALGHFEARRASKEALELLTLVKPAGAALPNLVAEDFNRTGSFEGYEQLICRAVEEGRKEFFIDLGKLLEGKRLKPNPWTKLDEDVAFILCLHPEIKSTEAVKLLKGRGHPPMSPWAFKQMKYNWKRAAMKRRHLWKEAGWGFRTHNSFLDGAEA